MQYILIDYSISAVFCPSFISPWAVAGVWLRFPRRLSGPLCNILTKQSCQCHISPIDFYYIAVYNRYRYVNYT